MNNNFVCIKIEAYRLNQSSNLQINFLDEKIQVNRKRAAIYLKLIK